MIGLYGISFWLPSIVKAMGVKGYLSVGLITAIPYAVAVVGMVFLSRHSDRTGERRLHYVLNVTAGGLGLVLSAVFADHPVLAIVFLAIGTLGVIGSMPIFWPVPSAFLAGTAAAAGIGIVNSVGNLGGYVGPNIPVWMKAFSADPSASLYVIAGALFLGAIRDVPVHSDGPEHQAQHAGHDGGIARVGKAKSVSYIVPAGTAYDDPIAHDGRKDARAFGKGIRL